MAENKNNENVTIEILSDDELEQAKGGADATFANIQNFVANQTSAVAHLVMMLHEPAGTKVR